MIIGREYFSVIIGGIIRRRYRESGCFFLLMISGSSFELILKLKYPFYIHYTVYLQSTYSAGENTEAVVVNQISGLVSEEVYSISREKNQ